MFQTRGDGRAKKPKRRGDVRLRGKGGERAGGKRKRGPPEKKNEAVGTPESLLLGDGGFREPRKKITGSRTQIGKRFISRKKKSLKSPEGVLFEEKGKSNTFSGKKNFYLVGGEIKGLLLREGRKEIVTL